MGRHYGIAAVVPFSLMKQLRSFVQQRPRACLKGRNACGGSALAIALDAG
jgi:hypothetical protein